MVIVVMKRAGISRLHFGLIALCFAIIGLDPVLGAQADPPIPGDFVVATNGDDGNPGTLERPFRSLAKARDAVRALKREQPAQPVTVLIRGGTYDQHESLVFSGRDSGTAAAPINYQAYPGEKPVFRGGRVITDWMPYQGNIFSAKLPQTENQYWRFRELFFNGKRQIRARYPNFDPQEPDFGGWAFIESTVPGDAPAATSFRYEVDVFPRRWAKPDQGEIFTVSPRLPYFDRLQPRG